MTFALFAAVAAIQIRAIGMKMETTIFADVGGEVTEIAVKPGDGVETKDLLVVVTQA